MMLLDASNLYETRIGKFDLPAIKTLYPEIRQYSDLQSWIDESSKHLRGNNILMCCTGGIRCEMASAYIRSKGAGFENVFQLYGGIQRYLEEFPDGGFFRGKNFVFDRRVLVGSLDTNILGTCLLCGTSYDDYTSRSRCSHCRMLVLICDNCRRSGKPMWMVRPKKISNTVAHEVKFNLDQAFFNHGGKYQEQTERCKKSFKYLKTLFSQGGPFYGILEFSQGAAMAALVSANNGMFKGEMGFRFVILCSGFAVNMGDYAEGSITCPSFYIFGSKERTAGK